jgi:8-oxo-dGTP pyrophosphatase MutT (NUDIX family)
MEVSRTHTSQQTVHVSFIVIFRFPGGVSEDGDASLCETAVRELAEEFLGLPRPHIDRPLLLNTKITLPVKGRQYKMHNYVVIDENDEWNDDIVSIVNDNLERKRESFRRALDDGSYWERTTEEKHALSPEIYRIQWIDLDTAIDMMASSLDDSGRCVDEWQETEFSKYEVSVRDPMYQSMMVLEEVRQLESVEEIRNRANTFMERCDR